MEVERKRILIFLLPFSLFLFFIGVSGFLQLRTERREILRLFENQGLILCKHLLKEAETELNYLEMVKTSSSVLLPQLFDLERLDEEILADLHERIFRSPLEGIEDIPVERIVIFDKKGKIIKAKGNLSFDDSLFRRLLKERSYTKIGKDFILTGSSMGELLFFMKIGKEELEELRRRYILKEVIEREGKAIYLLGINLYDNRRPVLLRRRDDGNSISFSFPFEGRQLKGYRIELIFSKEPLQNIIKKTKSLFLFIFSCSFILGGFFTYLMVKTQKAHEERIKEMERKMAVQERLVSLGRLASGVAHEIRNPLNAIALSIERLKKEFVPEEKREEYLSFLEIIKKEVFRVGRIVEELLSSSKPSVPKTKEDLKGLIDEVEVLLRPKLEEKRIRIENSIEEGFRIECQRERMKQVFFNLIQNSIEAIKSDGIIKIEAEKKDRFLNISIRDTGHGIKKEDLPKIFDYYFTTKDKGVGLGLPISYLILKDHGGEIEVISEEGKGTTFVIRLPWSV